jgi:hypothetical protein
MTDEAQDLILRKEGLLRLHERKDALMIERKVENMYTYSK